MTLYYRLSDLNADSGQRLPGARIHPLQRYNTPRHQGCEQRGEQRARTMIIVPNDKFETTFTMPDCSNSVFNRYSQDPQDTFHRLHSSLKGALHMHIPIAGLSTVVVNPSNHLTSDPRRIINNRPNTPHHTLPDIDKPHKALIRGPLQATISLTKRRCLHLRRTASRRRPSHLSLFRTIRSSTD